jgi:galactokinase/mevalonate kinase-like predicted kinase
MKQFLESLQEAPNLKEVQGLIDGVLHLARSGTSKPAERRQFIRRLLLNRPLMCSLSTHGAVDYLLSQVDRAEWTERFGSAVETEAPHVMVEIVDQLADVDHRDLLRLLPINPVKTLFGILRALSEFLEGTDGSDRYLRGMRATRILADIYAQFHENPGFWKRRSAPACCIDSKKITQLKEQKDGAALSEAYKARTNQLQRKDLRDSLAALVLTEDRPPVMDEADFGLSLEVSAPLRIGISSANASDNHLRSKEQGGKTLNASIDLQLDGETEPCAPIQVSARRIEDPRLILHSNSKTFKADFEASTRGDAAIQSKLFFAYRRGGDEALRLVKQALVHTGIVRPDTEDVMKDVSRFAGGGGLEITTRSEVLQGSGLGTSSILAAAILKALYRLCGNPIVDSDQEYPALYDQSLLLEQSVGLNSGWQDARGACGGPSAVKDFRAPPTRALPTPAIRYLEGIDEEEFSQRIVLFDTGIARPATRGLNVVLDAYLTRDSNRYAAVRESLEIHDSMVEALSQGDYSALGTYADRYWSLRCILDPDATNDAIRLLFESPTLREVTDGGLLSGAGGGGFAILVAAEGKAEELRKRLHNLRRKKAFNGSRVVGYRLNKTGICFNE